jgi:hypothetical protein
MNRGTTVPFFSLSFLCEVLTWGVFGVSRVCVGEPKYNVVWVWSGCVRVCFVFCLALL